MVYGVVDWVGKWISPGISLEGGFMLLLSLWCLCSWQRKISPGGHICHPEFCSGIRRLHFWKSLNLVTLLSLFFPERISLSLSLIWGFREEIEGFQNPALQRVFRDSSCAWGPAESFGGHNTLSFAQTVEIGGGSSHHAGDLWDGRWEMWRELVMFYQN